MNILSRLTPFALVLAATPALAEMPKGISHFTLDNGLEAVVIEDHRAPVVVQMLWYRIGSADEQPGKSGIAHYLEHLMFKGTDKLAAGELSKTVTANGGMDNAFTSYDFTTYFQRIASDRLPLIMEMESDRMANLRIGEDDWQAERQVVLEERSQRTDSDPGSQFAEERSAVQFYNHPYGRPVIGWRQEMEGLTREDAIAWYDAHYAPNAAVLVVAGDVTADQVRELAQKYYGPVPPKPDAARKPRPQEPVQRSPRRIERVDARVAQPVLIRTVIAPERNPGDQQTAAALTVLADLLAGSAQTSVLARDLVLTGKALYVNAFYDGLSVDPTTFGISLVPVPGVPNDEAEAALDAALTKFLTDGPDPAQLERVKTSIRAARVYAQDSAHGRAYDYGQGLAVGLTVEDVNDWPDILAAVTPEDIRAAAKLVLDSKVSVTGWLLPAPDTTDEAARSASADAAKSGEIE
ncbi:insulinase family protein [Paracoccus kondratievae]|uniref:Peptidase M16 n=1 Tax=Paracoccus kondratievae TaxID=135740 RepID=A0AAD3P519_9RHOB|nr:MULTISPECIES: pitrilysin family protein [Paracoccus]QFQ87882.1 insulinase family protein [Paracoccus kondratievae]GLK66290.1 peptidase M16 [Paracoccus kondratievae]SMG32416.1 zinc protease [Paracoccus sp. J56]